MLNAAGEVQFSGYILGQYQGSEPLDDYGSENGCSKIEFELEGGWVSIEECPKPRSGRVSPALAQTPARRDAQCPLSGEIASGAPAAAWIRPCMPQRNDLIDCRLRVYAPAIRLCE